MKNTHIIPHMAAHGFRQQEISEFIGMDQSTVSRHLKNPSKKDIEHFYKNCAYGAYTTKTGERILFNREYQPLSNKRRFVKDIVKQEWFYNGSMNWKDAFRNSEKQIVIFEHTY